MAPRELVRLVPWAAIHPGERDAQRIVVAFFERYRHAVTRILSHKFGSLADVAVVHTAVHDAFLRFFEPRGGFDPGRTSSDEECDANVIRYLVRGAGWKLTDRHRALAADPVELVDPVGLAHHSGEAATDELSPARATRRRAIADWVSSLPSRESDILRAYYLDDHPSRKGDRLPPPVVQALSRKYGIGAPALRQIKAKLRRDLTAYLETHVHAAQES